MATVTEMTEMAHLCIDVSLVSGNDEYIDTTVQYLEIV
jgi:hypothetical protein